MCLRQEELLDEIDRLKESLRNMEEHHHTETSELTAFFTKRISDMREMYQKELETAPSYQNPPYSNNN